MDNKEVNEIVTTEEGQVAEVPKIDAGTITRFVLLLLSLVNMVIEGTGHKTLPISNDDISTFISLGFAGVMALINFWKDNDVTAKARTRKAAIKQLEK